MGEGALARLELGQEASATRVFTRADLAAWAELAGSGPRPLGAVPGPLVAGMFSQILGMVCPGPGTNYLKQRLLFRAPALPDEELTASVTVTRLRSEKALVNLETICRNARGDVVCEGEALVLVKDVGMVR